MRATAPSVRALAAVALFTHAHLAVGTPACAPSPLSSKEAEALLQQAPELVSVRLAGGNPIAMRNAGRDTGFFYFSVYDSGPGGRASADGGLVGHYAVSRKTAQVFDDVLFEEIKSNQLASAQRQIRRQHCITADLLKAASHELP